MASVGFARASTGQGGLGAVSFNGNFIAVGVQNTEYAGDEAVRPREGEAVDVYVPVPATTNVCLYVLRTLLPSN